MEPEDHRVELATEALRQIRDALMTVVGAEPGTGGLRSIAWLAAQRADDVLRQLRP